MTERRISQIEPLNGIRGIAALMIMLVHYLQSGNFQNFPIPKSCLKVVLFGQTGVDLFFVLSGFLITRILISTKNDANYFKAFYVRRILRIFPLYYFFLIIFYFAAPLLEGRGFTPFSQTWWFWSYLQNIPLTFTKWLWVGPTHYWSLAVEEHFYLFWPLLVCLIPTRKLVKALWLIIGFAAVIRILFCRFNVDVFYFTFCRMDALAFGALLACFEFSGDLRKYRKLFLLILITIFPIAVFLWSRLSGLRMPLNQITKFFLVGLIYWAFLGLIIIYRDRAQIKAVFSNRLLTFCGEISYGLYVYHVFCLGLVNRFFPADRLPLVNFILYLSVAFVVSWLSFRFLESPFLRLKKHFPYTSR